jgi:uncharacterized membrane protein YfcA
MSPIDLTLFVAVTFAAAFVAGFAGFAFGLVAAAIWLHLLTPLQTAALIVSYGLIVQGYAVWKLRRAIRLPRLLPLLVGSQIGIPLGVELLRWAPAASLRTAVGVFLVVFSLYNLAKPQFRPLTNAGTLADGGVGVLSGLVGGATGLAGILPTIWAGLRGWTKDEQRAVFQPVAVAIFLGTAFWLGGSSSVDRDTVRLFVIGLPALLAGTWAGLRLYARLDDAGFRTVVLVLLLLAGPALIVPGLLGR